MLSFQTTDGIIRQQEPSVENELRKHTTQSVFPTSKAKLVAQVGASQVRAQIKGNWKVTELLCTDVFKRMRLYNAAASLTEFSTEVFNAGIPPMDIFGFQWEVSHLSKIVQEKIQPNVKTHSKWIYPQCTGNLPQQCNLPFNQLESRSVGHAMRLIVENIR